MTVVDLYTIQIILNDDRSIGDPVMSDADLAALMAETEENLIDLMPRGVRARIRRWDHPDPDEGNDDE